MSTKLNFKSGAFRKYLLNTSWMVFEKVFRLLTTFIVGIILVRYLGPDQFGNYSYSLSVSSLFGALASLGLDRLAVRELVNTPEKKGGIMGTVFLLRLTGAAAALLAAVIASFLLQDKDYIKIFIALVAFGFFFQSFNVIDFFFQSRVESKKSVIPLSVSLFGSAILKIIFVLFKFPLIWFVISVALESFFLCIGLILIYRQSGFSVKEWTFDKSIAGMMLRDSWPLILSGVAVSIYMKTGQIMINKMLTAEDVGYYSAAVRICEAWYFIPMAITTSLFPAIINARKISNEFYLNRLQKLYDLLSLSAILIAVPITIFAGDIINILYGAKFAEAAPVLSIYIWGGIFVSLGVASGQYLIAENLTKIAFVRTLIGGAINVLLNLFLIPLLGITGAAISTVTAYTFAVMTIGVSRKTKGQTKMLFYSLLAPTVFSFAFMHLKKYFTLIYSGDSNK